MFLTHNPSAPFLTRCMRLFALLLMLGTAPVAFAGKISLSIEELDIREVMKMLSREQRMNIFVAEGEFRF